MKVYLLTHGATGASVVGVFTTREKAEVVKARFPEFVWQVREYVLDQDAAGRKDGGK